MTTVLRCGTLFDGTGAPSVDDAMVVVDAGRISAIGRAQERVVLLDKAHFNRQRQGQVFLFDHALELLQGVRGALNRNLLPAFMSSSPSKARTSSILFAS